MVRKCENIKKIKNSINVKTSEISFTKSNTSRDDYIFVCPCTLAIAFVHKLENAG